MTRAAAAAFFVCSILSMERKKKNIFMIAAFQTNQIIFN